MVIVRVFGCIFVKIRFQSTDNRKRLRCHWGRKKRAWPTDQTEGDRGGDLEMLHSNFAFIMFTTWFSHCWVTKALFGLPLFWVIWLSSHHSNWELRGTHWKYCVWLDFLSLFSSLKLSLSWATMQKIGNTKLVFSVSELHNSVARW